MVDERRHAVGADALGEGPVGGVARGPLGVVGDPGRAAHQHERPDDLGGLDGDVERHAGAHRVAEVHGGAAGGGGQAPGRGQVGGDVARAAVAGRVEPHDLVIAGQVAGERAPAPAGLAEAVQQDDPRSRPVAFAVQHHGGEFLSLP